MLRQIAAPSTILASARSPSLVLGLVDCRAVPLLLLGLRDVGSSGPELGSADPAGPAIGVGALVPWG